MLLAGTLILAVCGGAAAAQTGLRVRGDRLVVGRGRGHVVQLRGVNRSGLEYACIQGWGFLDSPHPDQIDSRAMIAAMKSWDIDVVRVPLAVVFGQGCRDRDRLQPVQVSRVPVALPSYHRRSQRQRQRQIPQHGSHRSRSRLIVQAGSPGKKRQRLIGTADVQRDGGRQVR